MQFKNGVNYLTFTLKKKKISPAVSLLAAVALDLFCGMVSSFLPEKTVNFLSEEMILGIVPDNFFTPFLEGNPLQIIFLAVLAGMAMLILGNKVGIVSLFLEQANAIVLLIMENISAFVPVFIFGSLPEKSFSSFFDWSDNSFFCCRIFGEQESVRGKAGD